MTVKFAGSRVNETVRSDKDAKMATEDMKPQKKIEKVFAGGKILRLKTGTTISRSYTFAGKGGSKPIRKEAQLIMKYGGKKGQWSHAKGRGQVHHDDKVKEADIHWFYEPSVGYVEVRVKHWFD